MKNEIAENLFTQNEVNNAEKYISQFIKSSDFDRLNYLKTADTDSGLSSENFCFGKNIAFISINNEPNTPYYNLLSEKEFFKLVGFKNKLSAKSGNYQKSLYSHYIQAKLENDNGYISDVLKKAIVFRNNIHYVKELMHNEKFMEKWHKNCGRKSPLTMLKNSGDITLVNIINAI